MMISTNSKEQTRYQITTSYLQFGVHFSLTLGDSLESATQFCDTVFNQQ